MSGEDNRITQGILYGFGHRVRSVKDIELIGTCRFTPENNEMISACLLTGNYGKLSTLPPVEDLFDECFTVFRFRDQDNHLFYGYYYDLTGLSQDPEVMQIFPEVK